MPAFKKKVFLKIQSSGVKMKGQFKSAKPIFIWFVFWFFTSCGKADKPGLMDNAGRNIKKLISPGPVLMNPNPVMSKSSKQRFRLIMKKYGNKSSRPISDLVLMVGRELLGTRYVFKTLGGSPETLRANLDSLDCVTFIDQTVVLAQCLKNRDTSVSGFLTRLKKFRYRKGEIEDITSRLHYTSDLVYEKNRDKTWTDITKSIGGVKFPLTAYSYHLNQEIASYESSLAEKMKQVEDSIKSRTYHYIPVKDLPKHISKIKDGDILMLTASGRNLDINHLGIALHQNGNLYMMHASSAGGKVMISRGTLLQYLKVNRSDTGIMVARVNW